MPAKEQKSSEYVLGRGYAASARLNHQHYLWKDAVGYLLHPRIPSKSPDIKVADLGTGTGIWLIDLARHLPTTAQLDGFDTETSQCAPKEWLPSNMSVSNLDLYEHIPESLLGRYDIVNIRLFLWVCRNNDPVPILEGALKMLKPGGWLQWAEPDIEGGIKVAATGGNTFKALDTMQEYLRACTPADVQLIPTWVGKLRDRFTEHGMVDSSVSRDAIPRTHLTLAMENLMLGYEELSYSRLDKLGGGQGDRMRQLLVAAYEEYRMGSAINMDRVTVVARKSLGE